MLQWIICGLNSSLLVRYTLLSGINIYLLIPASLHQDPWMKELKLWLKKEDFDNRLSKINFIHYDAPNADKKFLEAIKKNDVNKQSIFIIEEVHRFINNVYNNISSNSGKKAQTIYNYIINQKITNHNTRIILLSATPSVNKPFEFALLFNLLRPDSFPSSESLFEELFESSNEKNNKNIWLSVHKNAKVLFKVSPSDGFYARWKIFDTRTSDNFPNQNSGQI